MQYYHQIKQNLRPKLIKQDKKEVLGNNKRITNNILILMDSTWTLLSLNFLSISTECPKPSRDSPLAFYSLHVPNCNSSAFLNKLIFLSIWSRSQFTTMFRSTLRLYCIYSLFSFKKFNSLYLSFLDKKCNSTVWITI